MISEFINEERYFCNTRAVLHSCGVFLHIAFVMKLGSFEWEQALKRRRPWHDSNLQSPETKSGALSNKPHIPPHWVERKKNLTQLSIGVNHVATYLLSATAATEGLEGRSQEVVPRRDP